jgi:hypothetical protein
MLTNGDIPRWREVRFGAEMATRFFQRPFSRPDRLQRVIKHGRAQGGALPSISIAYVT